MSNFKVGDLVRLTHRGTGDYHRTRGVITKLARGRNHRGDARYIASVFLFKAADNLVVNADWLTKVEDRGE